MEYGEKFRKSAFGGFKRQDVLQCIEELNAHHTEALEEKEAEKKELSEQLQALTEELEEQKRINAELTEKTKPAPGILPSVRRRSSGPLSPAAS